MIRKKKLTFTRQDIANLTKEEQKKVIGGQTPTIICGESENCGTITCVAYGECFNITAPTGCDPYPCAPETENGYQCMTFKCY